MKKKLVTRQLSQLRPHPRQKEVFAELSGVALQDLADTIAANGLLNPVEINGANVIIAGHGRVAAAQLLGWPEIDCWLRDDLTDEQADRRHVEDNLHRRQLSKLELARAYKALLELDSHELRNGARRRSARCRREAARRLRPHARPPAAGVGDPGRSPAGRRRRTGYARPGREDRIVAPLRAEENRQEDPRRGVCGHRREQVTAGQISRTQCGPRIGAAVQGGLELAEKNLQPNLHRLSFFHRVELPGLQRGSQLLAQLIQTIEKSTHPSEIVQRRSQKPR